MRVDHARRVFATLMQKARKGNLTEKDRETLSRARQTLRTDKRSSTRNPMRVRRTFASVKRELALLGITIRKGEFDPDEYIVNYRGGKEATAAYTNDLDDAYHTGVAMARERKNPRRSRIAEVATGKRNPQRGVVLYGRVLQIKAQKSKDSRYPGERFYHNFKTGAVAYGLPNGDILIRKEK